MKRLGAGKKRPRFLPNVPTGSAMDAAIHLLCRVRPKPQEPPIGLKQLKRKTFAREIHWKCAAPKFGPTVWTGASTEGLQPDATGLGSGGLRDDWTEPSLPPCR